MKRVRAAAALAVVFLLPGLLPAQQAPSAPAEPAQVPEVTIRFESNPLVECYFYLKTYGVGSLDPAPDSGVDLSTETGIYSRARDTLTTQEVWRWFEGLVVAGPDPAAVREAAAKMPSRHDSPRNRTGVNMLVEGLESAYPKFLDALWPQHQKGVNRVLVPARKHFLQAGQRITRELMEKMDFSAIDAPISVLVVVRAGGVTSWGRTPDGYFAILGATGMSALSLVEMGLHEATHILDTLQPYSSGSLLKQVRDRLVKEDAASVNAFTHGLIAYNAGALVSKIVSRRYRPEGVLAAAHAEEYRPYLSTYEFVWKDYLRGSMAKDEIVAKLVEEFQAIHGPQGSRKQAGS